MTKVLITGVNGLVGNRLLSLLSNNSEYRVFGTSIGKNRIKDVSFDYFDCDIRSKDAVENLFQETQPDIVIHTAAITQVDLCEKEKQLCKDVNCIGTSNVVEGCKLNSCFLIHLSTDFVFDGSKKVYTEADLTEPLSFYAKSKVEAEKIVLSSTLKAAVVRTILVYGVVESMSRSNLFLWVYNSLNEGKSIRVVNDQHRMPTFVDDLCKGCISLMKKRLEGVFHLSGPEQKTVYEIAKEIADYYKHDSSKIEPVSSLVLNELGIRPASTGFDLKKAKNLLNYEPLSISEGLKEFDAQLQKVK